MSKMAENIQDTTNGAIKLATIDADQNPTLADKLQGSFFNFRFLKTLKRIGTSAKNLKTFISGLSNPTTIKIKPNGEVSPVFLPNEQGRVINRFTENVNMVLTECATFGNNKP